MELTDKLETIENINYDDEYELSNSEGELRQFYDEFKSLLNDDINFMALAKKINDEFTKGYNILTNKS